MRSPKKSESIEVRLAFETKRAFAERCRAGGRTVSDVVREFVESELIDTPPLAKRPAVPAGLRSVAAFVGGAVLSLAVAFGPPSMAGPADLRPAFRALDKDGDGFVTPVEYGRDTESGLACGKRFVMVIPLERASMPEVKGIRPFALSAADFRFVDMDRDRNGKVTLAEYSVHQLRTLRAGFDHWDSNQDGMLSRAEHGIAYRTVFVGDPPAFAPFSELDRDGDGKVVWAEFLA